MRVKTDFVGGIRAGVTQTPTAFAGGKRLEGDLLRRIPRS